MFPVISFGLPKEDYTKPGANQNLKHCNFKEKKFFNTDFSGFNLSGIYATKPQIVIFKL